MKNRPNYQLKSDALSLIDSIEKSTNINLLDVMSSLSRHYYLLDTGATTLDEFNSSVYIQTLKKYVSAFEQEYPFYYAECFKIIQAQHKKRKRLQDKITNMLDSCTDVVFVTLTFSDDYLYNTSELYRRKSITAFLKKYCTHYIANIDFGKLNGREHYHAIIGIYLPLEALDEYRSIFNSSIHVERVRNYTTDTSKLARYVAKLTNHALKVTTKRQALIYSRECKKKGE